MKPVSLLLAAIATFIAVLHAKAANPSSRIMLTLEATVSVPSGDPLGAYALLFMEDRLVDSVSVDPEGGFVLDLPAGNIVTLEVRKPGYAPKRITMDTHHLPTSPRGFSLDTVIAVEVALLPAPEQAGRGEVVPAGRISFDPDNGDMRIEH